MKLSVILKVKFRFLGITIGNISQQWSFPAASLFGAAGTPADLLSQSLVNYNDHGVLLLVAIG